ncbi:MAG: SDR family oxidoreductase [Chloroflexota bacterium]|nr:SDR family oxidoreductase [Chloroflexota bacterium]
MRGGSRDRTTRTDIGPFDGRRALVTGAGTGIGLATARALATAGASVVLHSSQHQGVAASAADALRAAGAVATFVGCDLGVPEELDRVVDVAITRLGGLDILINNSGVTLFDDFRAISVETFDRHVAINLRAAYFCAQMALEALQASDRGAIVNVSSVHGGSGYPGASLYAATKGGIVAFTKALAIELAPVGVRVNAVAPGLTDVERAISSPGYTPEIGVSIVPIGRAGTPLDIANAIVFLASEAAGFITGAILYVDGGTHASMDLDFPGRGQYERASTPSAT